MKTDSETKELLLKSAKSEFTQKGYMKASLRKICADANVTTGALYFFFDNKEDLFAAIVEPPYQELTAMLSEYFKQDMKSIASKGLTAQDDDHSEIAQMLIHHLYCHYDEFMLLLTKAQGSRFENCVDELVALIEKNYRLMANQLGRQYGGYKISEYMCHWLTHMSVDAFIHLMTHEPSEKKAQKHVNQIMNFIVKSAVHMIPV